MSEANDFSQQVTDQITPANLGKAWYLTITLAIISTTLVVTMGIYQAQMQKDLMKLTSNVNKLTENHIRLEGKVDLNQAVNEIVHDQLESGAGK